MADPRPAWETTRVSLQIPGDPGFPPPGARESPVPLPYASRSAVLCGGPRKPVGGNPWAETSVTGMTMTTTRTMPGTLTARRPVAARRI